MTKHCPVLIVIAGPNGSGKTSVTSRLLKHEWIEDAVYINPDNVAKDIFGDWNNPNAVFKAADYCMEWREKCLKNRKSMIFETVMSANDKIDFILRAKQNGFFIRLFFISTSNPSINASRIAKRVMKGGHDVPISKIISRYGKSIKNCSILSTVVNRLYVYDNSEENTEARLLFRLSDGLMVKQYNDIIPDWAKIILPHKE